MTILQMTAQGSLVIVLGGLLRILGRDRLPKRSLLAIWGLALARLLLPFRITAPWSLYRLFNAGGQGGSSVLVFPSLGNAFFSPSDTVSAFGAASNAPQAGVVQSAILPISPAVVFWLTGLLATALIILLQYARGSRALREAIPVEETEVLTHWRQTHPLCRSLRILTSDRLGSPVTVGLVHPKIYLPRALDPSSAAVLDFVLPHEYFHVRYFDRLWKLAAVLAFCLHWFNPLVWVLACLLDRDLERRCDEAVLRAYPTDRRAAYARTLLDLCERQSRLTTGFAGNSTQERIVSIMKFKRKTLLTGTLAVAGVLVLGLTLLITPSKASEPDPPTASVKSETPYEDRGFYSWRDTPKEDQRNDPEAFYTDSEYISQNGTAYTLRTYSARWIRENGYPVNQRGETYGGDCWFGPDDVDELEPLGEPDLLLTEGDHGAVGYVRQSELNDAAEGRNVQTPDEAVVWMADPAFAEKRSVPLYLEDGVTIVDYFTLQIFE